MENISLENANYLQSLEEKSSKDTMPKFEVDSIELASPQLFPDEEMSHTTNMKNDTNDITMFDQTNPAENIEDSIENKENNEEASREPEMFEDKDSEDDFEIPAFLRRQKN